MSGKWILDLPRPHSCVQPNLDRDSVVGSIWQCDCGQSHECESDPDWGQPYWTPVTERRVRRALKKALRSSAKGPTS